MPHQPRFKVMISAILTTSPPSLLRLSDQTLSVERTQYGDLSWLYSARASLKRFASVHYLIEVCRVDSSNHGTQLRFLLYRICQCNATLYRTFMAMPRCFHISLQSSRAHISNGTFAQAYTWIQSIQCKPAILFRKHCKLEAGQAK